MTRFCEALSAEGVAVHPGINRPLHTHPIHRTADIYNDGKPTRLAFTENLLTEMDADLDVASEINRRAFFLPWFKHYWPEIIDQYADAFKKVVSCYEELLEGDRGDCGTLGGWHRFNHSQKT